MSCLFLRFFYSSEPSQESTSKLFQLFVAVCKNFGWFEAVLVLTLLPRSCRINLKVSNSPYGYKQQEAQAILKEVHSIRDTISSREKEKQELMQVRPETRRSHAESAVVFQSKPRVKLKLWFLWGVNPAFNNFNLEPWNVFILSRLFILGLRVRLYTVYVLNVRLFIRCVVHLFFLHRFHSVCLNFKCSAATKLQLPSCISRVRRNVLMVFHSSSFSPLCQITPVQTKLVRDPFK